MTDRWTDEEVIQLMDLWNVQKISSGDIGLLFNKTPKSVLSKIKRLRKSGVEMRSRVTLQKKINKDAALRNCLRCQNSFQSESRFNRICYSCARINAGVNDRSIMKLVS